MTAIMEMVVCAKKGNLKNIKENFHIYYLNKTNKLIEEQKPNMESHNQNNMFDIIVNISTRPTDTSRHTRDINTRHDIL
jgi:hypothetical protein